MASLGYKLSKTTLFPLNQTHPPSFPYHQNRHHSPPFFNFASDPPPFTIFFFTPHHFGSLSLSKISNHFYVLYLLSFSGPLKASLNSDRPWIPAAVLVFRRREGWLERKGLIFLVILMLFFLLQLHNTIFSTLLFLSQFGRRVVVVLRRRGPIFPAKGLLLKVGGSFSSSFCKFFMLQLHFSSSFPSFLFKLGQSPKGRFRRVLDGGRQ